MVKVFSTKGFLESKLANLENKLRTEYQADEEQLLRIHEYVCTEPWWDESTGRLNSLSRHAAHTRKQTRGCNTIDC
jgi:hypothetical protein